MKVNKIKPQPTVGRDLSNPDEKKRNRKTLRKQSENERRAKRTGSPFPSRFINV